MPNNLALLGRVLSRLEAADLGPTVFGGWAEELRGLSPARPHRDIDLLLVGPTPLQVDTFLDMWSDVVTLPAKRFGHKRAFLIDGVMVETFLTHEDPEGWSTLFFGRYLHRWPQPLSDLLESEELGPALVATENTLRGYRSVHHSVSSAYQAHLKEHSKRCSTSNAARASGA